MMKFWTFFLVTTWMMNHSGNPKGQQFNSVGWIHFVANRRRFAGYVLYKPGGKETVPCFGFG